MNTATSYETIDVDSLRIGMFIQLDGGWMSHPFPLSNFRITSPEQIATIHSLGVRQLRWVPSESDAPPPPPRDDSPPGPSAPAAPAAVASAADRAETDAAALRRARRDQHGSQRAALNLCERQFAEAADDCRRITDLVLQRPQEAREQAEVLISALSTKMLGPEELCIRLLTDAAGDKSSHHALNVTVISMLMGRTFGLSESELVDLGLGAMLHDIGKLELPARVRHREEQFTSAENRFYEDHVAVGVALAKKMKLAPGAALVLAQHHEHADRSGFPMRLNADRMSFAARIVALVNRYDNLCNPHRPGLARTPHESLSLLFTQGKSQFETAILGAFIKMMGVYPAGSTVQLTDDRYALVVSVNSSRPLKPRVLVHDTKVPAEEALFLDLEQAASLGIRRCLKPQQLPPPVLDYLAPRPKVAYFFEASRETAGAA